MPSGPLPNETLSRSSSSLMIAGSPRPNIPWEERPPACADVVWRFSRNPIIARDAIPTANSIFNSAVVPFGDGFAGVFRCDDRARRMNIHAGFSADDIHWRINPQPIAFRCHDTEIGALAYRYDPRVCWGVLTSCNGFVYSFGAALLDLDQPWKVIYRTAPYLLSPQMLYECVGDVPNVVFPCAALTDAATGRVAIYYGAADTVTGLAFGYLQEIVAFLKENSQV